MPRRFTKQDFINKANTRHNFKYDYSLVEYIDIKTKVEIICPVKGHGIFKQRPDAHLWGQGCVRCSTSNITSNTEEFINKANKIHNFEYNYEKVNYINAYTKIIITCIFHGDFEQKPNNHLNGNTCPLCADVNRRLTTDEFILKANIIHNNFYDYSNSKYTHSWEDISIICPNHGKFVQKARNHLEGATGCVECQKESQRSDTETFIKKSNLIHNFKYNYSKVDYVLNNIGVTIICPTHGEFIQRPDNHLSGNGCQICAKLFNYICQYKNNTDTDMRCTLYLINIFDDRENFYKIGITSKTVNSRFYSTILPYNYKILKSISGDANYIIVKEQEILKKFSHLKYIPNKEFGGRYECFTKEILNYL